MRSNTAPKSHPPSQNVTIEISIIVKSPTWHPFGHSNREFGIKQIKNYEALLYGTPTIGAELNENPSLVL